MLTKDGRIKVLDFGLAKLADAAPAAALSVQGPLTTSSGQIVGTLSYMAPEQAEGRSVDHRADIFGLGVLLYELAAGIRPFGGESNVAVLTALLRDTPRPITEMRSDLPLGLAPIVQRCLEKDPTSRYQSAADLRAALEELRASTTPVLRRPVPAWLVPAVVATLLITAGLGWLTLRRPVDTLGAGARGGASAVTPVLITGRQVALLDFTNSTGDPSLDAFGRMVSEAIAGALASEGIPMVSATDASAADGVTVAGAYVVEGDELRFDARLMSASRGAVIRILDPIRVPRGGLQAGADVVRQRLMLAIVATFASQQQPSS
jgi:hypothetical protein